VLTSVISPTPRLVRVIDSPTAPYGVTAHSVGVFDHAAAATMAASSAPNAAVTPETSVGLGTGSGVTRVLSVEEFGDPDGKPIFWQHTEVGSRVSASILHKPAFELGLRVICIDRPGHGLSGRNPRLKSLMDWPKDVAAVADALRIKRFGVAGWSGGAPFALGTSVCGPFVPCAASAKGTGLTARS
jgi:hypothetical protein